MQKRLYNIIYAFSYCAMHVIKMNLFELPKQVGKQGLESYLILYT